MQTSPEPDVQRTSQQTSPFTIVEEEVAPVVEVETKEIQTSCVEASEMETQTTQPQSMVQQESQTEAIGDQKEEAVREIDTVDTSNQTVSVVMKEMQQQADNTEEIVGPILGQIVREVVDPASLYTPQSMQTSPVSFAEHVEQTAAPLEVAKSDESAQTTAPEQQDAVVETDVVQYEDRGISPTVETLELTPIAPVTTIDSAMQTSPMHVVEHPVETKYEIQDEILIQTVQTAPLQQPTTTLESTLMQTEQVPTVEMDAQTVPVAVTEITETLTISTQTKERGSSMEVPSAITEPSGEKEGKQSKKKKSKKSKEKSIPIEVEVSTQMIAPATSGLAAGAHGQETVTVTKTIISEATASGIEGRGGDIDLNIQVEIDPSYGTVEVERRMVPVSANTALTCKINESLDPEQSVSLRLSLSDYFSIIKSQQSYAEKCLIPWQDINRMFLNMKPFSADEHQQQRDNYRTMALRRRLTLAEEEAAAESDELEHVLGLLQSHEHEAPVQQQLLFEVVESVIKSLEDVSDGLSVAQLSAEDQPSHAVGTITVEDRVKLHRLYKIRLIRIEEHIVRIITYVQRSKGSAQNKDVDECLNHLLRQVQALEESVGEEERKADENSTNIRRINDTIRELANRLERLEGTFQELSVNESVPIVSKLRTLEEIEGNCRSVLNVITTLTNEYNALEVKPADDTRICEELDRIGQQLRRLENGIVLIRQTC